MRDDITQSGEQDSYLSRNAGRLMRQTWRNATDLAHELYTMISDRKSAAGLSATSARVQARKAADASLADVNALQRAASRSSRDAEEAPQTLTVHRHATGRGAAMPMASRTPPPTSADSVARPIAHAPFVDPSPIRSKPYVMDSPIKDDEWHMGIPGGGSGTNTLQGIVVDGSDPVHPQVQLYPSGSAGKPGSTVTVHILQVSSDETIPVGTWITGINTFSDASGTTYEAQLPIWLE